MQCAIYKSRKKQDTYLYTATKDDFSRVPETLLKLIGELVHVMDLDLSPERKLAQEDTAEYCTTSRNAAGICRCRNRMIRWPPATDPKFFQDYRRCFPNVWTA